MKKLLIVSDNLPDQINGVVTTFSNIKKHAEKNGYIVYFINPQHFKYFSMPRYPEVKMSIPFGIGKMIEDINPDYIHISTEGPVGLAARIYCDIKKYKYNTSYHTKFPEYLEKMYNIPQSITYRYVRWFHKHSGKVLATTKSMVDELKENNFRSDIVVWTRGVDRDLLKPSMSRTKNKNIVVLYVGRVSKEKGLDDLCILQRMYDVIIVGDGPYRKHLEEKYKNVKFLGYKTGSELADEYMSADVFCFPSKTDTFGIVLIEAMSLGTPIAAYPVSGPVDIVEQGVTGYLGYDLIECIQKCLDIDNQTVIENSKIWTWENCWNIFEKNLVKKY
jgi:glycosyltransferase involved in cell wall biosynthesis